MDNLKSSRSRETYIRIPKLRQKLGVLYFNQSSITNDEQFGKRFDSPGVPGGITGRTIRHWTDGDKSRPPDVISIDRIDRFVEIFQSCLPGKRSSQETLAILRSKNVADLLSAFAWGGGALEWIANLHAAPSGGIRLVDRGPLDGFGLTSRRKPYEAVDELVTFPARHSFQFDIPSLAQAWIHILQNVETGWFCIDDFFAEPHAARTLLPSSEPYFYEKDVMACTYAFLHAPVPFSPHLHQRLKLSQQEKGPVDIATLEVLAQFASSTPHFRINSVHVRFTS